MSSRHPLPPATPISSAAVDSSFLAPAMEARARNLQQYDPSAAVDSQLERIQVLALQLPPSAEREDLLREVDEAIASNLAEAAAELALCGSADELVADLRHGETNSSRVVFGAKAIARHLRPALGLLSSPEGRAVADLTAAHTTVRDTVNEVPRLMLLSDAVERELGAAKFAVLRAFATKRGAERSAVAGASQDQASGPGAEL